MTDALHRWLCVWGCPAGGTTAHWNPRLRTTAGRAFPRGGRVELNPNLLAVRCGTLAFDAVMVHEAAHLAVHRLLGPNLPPHGEGWRGLVREAGFEPTVHHGLIEGRESATSCQKHAYLHFCDLCEARQVQGHEPPAKCRACGARGVFLTVRATATPAGLARLEGLCAAEIRATHGLLA